MYEYLALKYETRAEGWELTQTEEFARISGQGWVIERWVQVPYRRIEDSGVCIMRREKREPTRPAPTCEGRLWTEREISHLISDWEMAQDSAPHRRWSEEELEALIVSKLDRVKDLLLAALSSCRSGCPSPGS